MKKLTLLTGFLLLAGPVLAQDCDRDCLRGSTAGTHVLAMENGNPVLVAIRLKIEGGKVSEAETTVVRNREELVRLAMLYPAGLRIGSFVEAGGQFADETYRFENGQLMAGPGCA